jgi:arylsulfatase A-like enzyme
VTDHALAWLKQNGEREDSRFFLFLHYFDPHYFYNHHAEFDQTSGYRGTLTAGMDIHALLKQRFSYDAADLRYLVGLYREEIAYTDYHLGRFFDYLQKTGFNKNTLIVFVADHGEEFMRHGFIGHVRTLYDELIHVPLIVSLPGKLSPKVVTTPVSQIDIVPTLMALWKEPPPALPFDGQNLVPWLMAEQAKPALREIFTEVDSHSKSKEKAAFKSAIISGKWKLIHDKPTDSWELFNRETDPEELKNIIEQEAVLAKVLQEKLGLFEKNQASGSKETEIDINPEEVEQLKSLGYM